MRVKAETMEEKFRPGEEKFRPGEESFRPAERLLRSEVRPEVKQEPVLTEAQLEEARALMRKLQSEVKVALHFLEEWLTIKVCELYSSLNGTITFTDIELSDLQVYSESWTFCSFRCSCE